MACSISLKTVCDDSSYPPRKKKSIGAMEKTSIYVGFLLHIRHALRKGFKIAAAHCHIRQEKL